MISDKSKGSTYIELLEKINSKKKKISLILIKAHGESSNEAPVYRWTARPMSEHEEVADDYREGRPLMPLAHEDL